MRVAGLGRSAARGAAARGGVLLLAALSVLVVSLGAVPGQPLATADAAPLPVGLPKVLDGMVTGFTRMGPLVVVAGTFSQVEIDDPTTGDPLTVVNRPRLFAFDATTGLYDPDFRPILNGAVLALAGTGTTPDDERVYVGGTFTTVNGLPYRKLVALKPDGSADETFVANADNRVQALAVSGSRLFVGGQFTVIRGVARTRLAQLDAATGRVARSFNLPLTGTAGAGGTASVQTLAVSPDGKRLLVAHTAQRIAGQPRYGIGLIDIAASTATLDPWRTDLWSSRLGQTGGLVRVTSAAWGPDSSWFVVTNTGGDVPPINDCVQRFDLPAVPTTSPVEPTWVTRMFDSTYSSAVGPDGSVYVGGHFQFTEAPGAVDPYPGDPDVNYGGGLATEGARTLGQQVVNRPQVAALDPATGHASNWWSSGSGHKGVTALMVTPEHQVLIGSDGGRVDGQDTGRVGSTPAADAPLGTGVATSTVTSPVNGANLDVGSVVLTGTASAPSGVDAVKVEVTGNGHYQQLPADVASPGATTSDWSLDLPLTDPGVYSIKVRTWGQDSADLQPVKTSWHLLTNDPDNAPPATHWTSPRQGAAAFPSHTFTVSGTSNDPDGVAGVELTFYNQELHSYVSSTGELDPFVSNQATLASPGAASTTWSLPVTLPDGHYSAYAKGTDSLGTTDPHGTRLTFSLFPGNRAPGVQITTPKPKARVGAFTVTGRATDDHGVSKVLVHVADLRYGMGAQPTGQYGLARWLPATLAHPGRTSTTWSVRVPRLPFGTYQVIANAVDRSGLTTPTGARPTVTVRRWPAGATAEPATTLLTPTSSTRYNDLGVALSGSATYQPGVTSVRYSMFDTGVGRYLQGDGTLATTPYLFPADVVSAPGSTRTWSATTTLPNAGTWRLDAVATGAGGAVDSSPSGSRALIYVYPGDHDPWVEVHSPASGPLTGGPQALTISGRAFDDVGVRRVQVLVTDTSGMRGLRANLTVGAHPVWVEAFVTNVGGTSTNYNLVTPVLSAGDWHVSVRAIDSVGKPQAVPEKVDITIS